MNQKMKRHAYVVVLAVVAALIVVPVAIARICGAPLNILGGLAVFQMLISLLFFLTMPVTLVLCIAALVKKEWKKAGVLFLGTGIPLLTLMAVAYTNDPGWQAVMGI